MVRERAIAPIRPPFFCKLAATNLTVHVINRAVSPNPHRPSCGVHEMQVFLADDPGFCMPDYLIDRPSAAKIHFSLLRLCSERVCRKSVRNYESAWFLGTNSDLAGGSLVCCTRRYARAILWIAFAGSLFDLKPVCSFFFGQEPRFAEPLSASRHLRVSLIIL